MVKARLAFLTVLVANDPGALGGGPSRLERLADTLALNHYADLPHGLTRHILAL